MRHPASTEKDAVNYVAALGQVGARMKEAIAESQRLAGKNLIPPRFIVQATITQMKQFAATPPSDNPFVSTFDQRMSAAKTIPDARRTALRQEAESIVKAQVYPAWQSGIAFLEGLVSRATDDAGLWRLKGGPEA